MPTTQSITRRRYVHDQEKQEHRRGVKVIRVPTDFAKRYLYRLVMTLKCFTNDSNGVSKMMENVVQSFEKDLPIQ
uniref:Uncharacterized protein n=1 Tax=Romanomermis culicivorax TaxID=13658 RepID=A0A915HQV5_ROMCU